MSFPWIVQNWIQFLAGSYLSTICTALTYHSKISTQRLEVFISKLSAQDFFAISSFPFLRTKHLHLFSNSRIWDQDRTVYHWKVSDFHLKVFNSRNWVVPLIWSYLEIWNWDLKCSYLKIWFYNLRFSYLRIWNFHILLVSPRIGDQNRTFYHGRVWDVHLKFSSLKNWN